MTERVLKAYEQLLDYANKHKCCGRRFKRRMYRMLRMNAWDVRQKDGVQNDRS